MNRFTYSILILIALSGCAVKPVQGPEPQSKAGRPFREQVTAFSLNPAGATPKGWSPLIILRDKKPTNYRMVRDKQRIVLHAHADGASSALMHEVMLDPEQQPWLHWEWKIKGPVTTEEKVRSPAERGSPVRIVLGFDGDKDALPFSEQILFDTAKLITGHDFPYATLMYVWAENLPPGTVVPSRHSSRIRMVVAESGSAGVDSWRSLSRNVVEDFERAFGEKPGRLLGVGVLTDDASGEATEAWYGDIVLSSRPTPAAPRSHPGNSLILTKSK